MDVYKNLFVKVRDERPLHEMHRRFICNSNFYFQFFIFQTELMSVIFLRMVTDSCSITFQGAFKGRVGDDAGEFNSIEELFAYIPQGAKELLNTYVMLVGFLHHLIAFECVQWTKIYDVYVGIFSPGPPIIL